MLLLYIICSYEGIVGNCHVINLAVIASIKDFTPELLGTFRNFRQTLGRI